MPSKMFLMFGPIFSLSMAVLYIYMSLALMAIATKTNTENGWLAWIPIANVFLVLNIAQKPVWWIILCLIPLVNIVIFILVWMAVAEARHKPNWWGKLTGISILTSQATEKLHPPPPIYNDPARFLSAEPFRWPRQSLKAKN